MPDYHAIYGPAFAGYQGRLNDRTMPREETDTLSGVLCNEGGIKRTFGTVKNTSVTDHVGYAAGFTTADATYIQFGPDTGTFPVLGSRWTVLGAFKLTAKDQAQYVFDRVVTVSGTPYHAPALIVNADNRLTLHWTNSTGVDKSITSTSTVTTGTSYYFIARRSDDDIALYIGTDATSFTEWASGTGCGVNDFPADAGTHLFVIGARGTASTPDADFFEGVIDGITVLELALDTDELDMGYLEWPQPLMDRCLLHAPLEAAAGSEFQDLGPRMFIGSHDADVTHHETALLGSPTPIQLIDETRAPDGRQYVNLVADGSLYASRLNA